jgi:hypothetical protein
METTAACYIDVGLRVLQVYRGLTPVSRGVYLFYCETQSSLVDSRSFCVFRRAAINLPSLTVPPRTANRFRLIEVPEIELLSLNKSPTHCH